MIEVQGLVKNYGALRAVDGVSFKVNRGDILGFLGPNGAGKSTTMKVIMGFLRPTAGTAIVGGHDVTVDPVAVKRMVGLPPGERARLSGDDVEEFLGFIAEVRGFRTIAQSRPRIERVVDLCHLTQVRRQTIETLSKGFKQRVGFAQALLHDRRCSCSTSRRMGLIRTRNTRFGISSSRWLPRGDYPLHAHPGGSRGHLHPDHHHHARKVVVDATPEELHVPPCRGPARGDLPRPDPTDT